MEHQNQGRNRGYNSQNRQWNQETDDFGYQQQDNRHQRGGWNEQDQSRVSYLPDNDDNRDYGSGGYSRGNYGNMGNQQSQSYGRNYNDRESGSRTGNQHYGGASYGQQSFNDWDQRNRYGYSGAGGAYGSDYGNRDYGRSQLGHQYGTAGTGYQNQGYGSSSEGYRSDYQQSGRNQYRGNDQYSHGNTQHPNNNRNWWDRTRDEVASWFGDDDAERRRNTERQSNPGPYTGKGPRGYQRSQERIKEDVCDRLSDDHMLDASNIEVDVQGTEVILSGNVHSKEEKRRAEDLVERISGVQNVENRLRVDRTGNAGTETWSQSIGL